MKKNVMILVVAMLILLNSSFASADTLVYGYLNNQIAFAEIFITADNAWSYTTCNHPDSFIEAELTYQYYDVELGVMHTDYTNWSANHNVIIELQKPMGNRYRSYAAYGHHKVTLGYDVWEDNIDIMY